MPNKVNSELKEMILRALDGVGGVDYLQQQANENPTSFLALVGKVLPMTVAGTAADGGHVIHVVSGVPRADG